METHKTQVKHKPLKEALFERIEADQVCPRSRMVFLGKECSFWILWMIAVVVGALAFAVTMLATIHVQYALYEATHENFFTFMVDVLPYLWIFTLGLMIVGAVYNLRHTKRGYRYPVWMAVASSVVLSFAGGSALHYSGLGYRIDDLIGQHLAVYMSQKKLEEALWQAPESGRLVGRMVYQTVQPTSTVIFEDSLGKRWRVEMADLAAADMHVMATADKVRLLGMIENREANVFHACGAFPWMMRPEVTAAEMSRERKNFIERVSQRQEDNAGADRQALGTESVEVFEAEVAALRKRSMCTELEVVKRMPKRE